MTKTLLLACFLSLAGCAGHSSDSTDTNATAPTPIAIHDLSLTPTSVPVGKVATLSGMVSFDAPDANVAQLAADVTLPGGTTQSIPRSEVPSAKGLASGPLAVALLLAPPVPGDYVITLRLIDSAGTPSNPLSVTITAE
jgi:hypothetical protein